MIDDVQAKRIAPYVRKLVELYSGEGIDRFDNPDYYPPSDSDEEHVARYFLVMVAMDHRLSRPGRPYEAVIGGKFYHGADLLYRLGAEKYHKDPSFFSPERLAAIKAKDVKDWLCVNSLCPVDVERRTALLRDLGVKLLNLFDGEVMSAIRLTGGRLRGVPEKPGFIDLFKVFLAYNDPVEKKLFLLAKFLERRGVIGIVDRENKRVPVDNHVARIALRLGLVRLKGRLAVKHSRGEEFNDYEDVLVRINVREAWHGVAVEAGVDDFILDDVLWAAGRKNCTREKPSCHSCVKGPFCVNRRCLLREVCPVALGAMPALPEHNFLDTWWY